MKNRLKLLWYYAETRYVKLLRIFGVRRSASFIPTGMYCYVWDEKRNTKEPCKYYRSTTKTGGVACTYTGYYGFDPCLYDQCKICGVNDELDERDLS